MVMATVSDLRTSPVEAMAGQAQTAVMPELLVMLKDQLQNLATALADNLAISEVHDSSDVQACLSQLEFAANAAEMAGLSGLQCALDYIQANLLALIDTKEAASVMETALIRAGFDLILAYLGDIEKPDSHSSLVRHLQKPQWREPVSDDEALELIALLGSVRVSASEESSENSVEADISVSSEDVSLLVSSDVNPDLLESLLEELPDLIVGFSEAMARVLDSHESEAIREAQRIAHTLKGSGNMVGVAGIANLTHGLEDILEAMAEQGLMPDADLTASLADASECLEVMGDALLGVGEAPPQAEAVLEDILHWSHQLTGQERTPKRSSVEDANAHRIAENEPVAPDASTQAGAKAVAPTQASTVTTQEAGADEKTATVKIATSEIDGLLRVAGETSLLSSRMQEQLRYAASMADAFRVQQRKLRQLVMELERLVQLRELIPATAFAGAGQPSATVSGSRFDALEMDQYSELNSYANQFTELAADMLSVNAAIDEQLGSLGGLVSEQEKAHKFYQNWALNARMLPVQTIVSRCQRVIRQASQMTDKQVQLRVLGETLRVDSSILEQLVDPLMHLLRNSVDHGIEASELRTFSGKSPHGTIQLSFLRQGRYLQIVCEDDGAGLDFAEIRRKAENKGLLSWNQATSDEDLTQMILMPGFSTRDSATQISGRGVGMDAVHTQIRQMNGSLKLKSRSGEGLKVEIQIPMILQSTQCLLVLCQERVVAILHYGIEQLLYPGSGEVRQTDSGWVYHWEQQDYPASFLDTLLNIPKASEPEAEAQKLAIMIVGSDGVRRIVLVDQALENRDLVIKQLGDYVPPVKGIVGATILGDGSVTPVLDVPELLSMADRQAPLVRDTLRESAILLPRVLVVDDSVSARQSLVQFLQDMGYRVDTAIDGMDAVSKINQHKPDVMLTDMEMPRMNGLELTGHIRNREDTQNLPVIMITSRSSEKHRRQAEEAGVSIYLTKPWSDVTLVQELNQALALIPSPT